MYLQDDTRIIQRHEQLAVHAQRHEVMFKDGTSLALHPVSAHGTPQMFLRAVQHESGLWLVFDLRHLDKEIESEVLRLHSRDTPGVVFYTLRRYYTNATACLAGVLAQHTTSWQQQQVQELAAA
jgi:hypothetical protein